MNDQTVSHRERFRAPLPPPSTTNRNPNRRNVPSAESNIQTHNEEHVNSNNNTDVDSRSSSNSGGSGSTCVSQAYKMPTGCKKQETGELLLWKNWQMVLDCWQRRSRRPLVAPAAAAAAVAAAACLPACLPRRSRPGFSCRQPSSVPRGNSLAIRCISSHFPVDRSIQLTPCLSLASPFCFAFRTDRRCVICFSSDVILRLISFSFSFSIQLV